MNSNTDHHNSSSTSYSLSLVVWTVRRFPVFHMGVLSGVHQVPLSRSIQVTENSARQQHSTGKPGGTVPCCIASFSNWCVCGVLIFLLLLICLALNVKHVSSLLFLYFVFYFYFYFLSHRHSHIAYFCVHSLASLLYL